MVSKKDVIQLYSHAAVFCCPSIYEPFGIINIEAMACNTAVVASSVGAVSYTHLDVYKRQVDHCGIIGGIFDWSIN